jgi:hypothetical protein
MLIPVRIFSFNGVKLRLVAFERRLWWVFSDWVRVVGEDVLPEYFPKTLRHECQKYVEYQDFPVSGV